VQELARGDQFVQRLELGREHDALASVISSRSAIPARQLAHGFLSFVCAFAIEPWCAKHPEATFDKALLDLLDTLQDNAKGN
jgi:hypothetical protein